MSDSDDRHGATVGQILLPIDGRSGMEAPVQFESLDAMWTADGLSRGERWTAWYRRSTTPQQRADQRLFDSVVQRVLDTVDMYRGPEAYRRSQQALTRSQCWLFAVVWYASEVDNGGHRQFYDNSTGIVWRDARDGFEAFELPRFAEVLSASAERMGGAPPLEREPRQDLLDRLRPDFGDLDTRFYALDEGRALKALLIRYVLAHPVAFAVDELGG